MNKSQKVVVVTSASRGIGAKVVKAFRKLDYRIVATSRSIKLSDDEYIMSIAGDIGDPATAQRVISEGVARFGRIDTLVNNAGTYIGKPFTEHIAEDYAAVMKGAAKNEDQPATSARQSACSSGAAIRISGAFYAISRDQNHWKQRF